MRKIPCPRCSDIWLYYSDMDRFQWKMNCNCGYAWINSQWKNTKIEAVQFWNDRVRDTTKKVLEIDTEQAKNCASISCDLKATQKSFEQFADIGKMV